MYVKNNNSKLRTAIIILIILICLLLTATIIYISIEFSNINPSLNQDYPNSDYSSSTQNNERLLILVNENHPISDTFKLNLSSYESIPCDAELLSNFNELKNAGLKAGFNITITKGYVDIATQQKVHDELVNNLMSSGYTKIKAESEASKSEPKGGCSELQTGLVVDVNTNNILSPSDFSNLDDYKWLYDNCVYYGFILRFPENKEDKTSVDFNPCRYRYVGKENAIKMRALNMCFEEYYEYFYTQNLIQ